MFVSLCVCGWVGGERGVNVSGEVGGGGGSAYGGSGVGGQL